LVGCGGEIVRPELTAHPQLVLTAPPGVLQNVAQVTVTVSGPGMTTMTRNLTIQGSQATGTLTVPAGEDRRFSVEAKDAGGGVLATGSRTVDLEAGSSPTITIALSIPTSVELVYDDGEPSQGYYWPQAGYGFGVHMTAPQYPATVTTMSYYVADLQGGGSGDGSFTAYVFDYDGEPREAPLSPGIPVTPATTGWVDVDASGYSIQVQRDFVVAMICDGVNTPVIGADAADNGRTWDALYDSGNAVWGWLPWPETYFIRATVTVSTGETLVLSEGGG
jgi:hypothetical protein